MIARLRSERLSARAIDALDAVVQCAPAPPDDHPEEKSDAEEYVLLYYQAKSQSKIQAEAMLVMRKSVEEMLKQRQKPVADKPVAEKAADKKPDQQPQVPAPVVVEPKVNPAPIDKPPVVPPPQVPEKPKPIINVLKRKGNPANIPVAFERESVIKVIDMAIKEGNLKAERYAQGVDFFSVNDGTPVEELEEQEPDDVASRVKILEGPKVGRIGWVPKSFLRVPPNEAAGWLRTAKLLEPRLARSWYERILKKYPDSPEAKEAKKVLDAMPKSAVKP